ncbi:galactosylgalactosylxylosylprotein 3-beta-glucuronosyltransferase 2-like [Watersipora subatra]|uniref:galactosylgalactosylxylosylprotein 3-beta-glucuronosyltransferase 2-like n=1 Tax=Watersipora subatra TaxID=2589382 RepID=UPI00355B2478
MAHFSGRDLIYVLMLCSAVWFLIMFVQLESCRGGINDHQPSSLVTYRKALAAKEKEIKYLREHADSLNRRQHVVGLPTIYIITPTYTRPVQKAELTRLSTVFHSISNVHWIVVEDSDVKSNLVVDFLKDCELNTTHLLSVTPPDVKLREKDPNWLKPRGVLQRNTGLAWLRSNLNADFNHGVVYFADDDNTYSVKLFAEMRDTKKVSVWPVGLVGKLRYESPLIEAGKVIGWHTYWFRNERPFAMDMAGFAVNLHVILENSLAKFDINAKRGFQESVFLQALGITLEDLEPKASMCTKVLVWHTRTEPANLSNEEKMEMKGYKKSDSHVEV